MAQATCSIAQWRAQAPKEGASRPDGPTAWRRQRNAYDAWAKERCNGDPEAYAAREGYSAASFRAALGSWWAAHSMAR